MATNTTAAIEEAVAGTDILTYLAYGLIPFAFVFMVCNCYQSVMDFKYPKRPGLGFLQKYFHKYQSMLFVLVFLQTGLWIIQPGGIPRAIVYVLIDCMMYCAVTMINIYVQKTLEAQSAGGDVPPYFKKVSIFINALMISTILAAAVLSFVMDRIFYRCISTFGCAVAALILGGMFAYAVRQLNKFQNELTSSLATGGDKEKKVEVKVEPKAEEMTEKEKQRLAKEQARVEKAAAMAKKKEDSKKKFMKTVILLEVVLNLAAFFYLIGFLRYVRSGTAEYVHNRPDSSATTTVTAGWLLGTFANAVIAKGMWVKFQEATSSKATGKKTSAGTKTSKSTN